MNLRLHIFFCQVLWLAAVLNGKSFQGVPGYGRNLLIKAIPEVEDYQSNIYEVFMEPYLYVSRYFIYRHDIFYIPFNIKKNYVKFSKKNNQDQILYTHKL